MFTQNYSIACGFRHIRKANARTFTESVIQKKTMKKIIVLLFRYSISEALGIASRVTRNDSDMWYDMIVVRASWSPDRIASIICRCSLCEHSIRRGFCREILRNRWHRVPLRRHYMCCACAAQHADLCISFRCAERFSYTMVSRRIRV